MSGNDGRCDSPLTVRDLLEQSAKAALDLQREDGSFPPSRNAHYQESLTAVRTTAHWMLAMAETYDQTKKEVYLASARHAADYLVSKECRPNGESFYCRNVEGKDKCNGVVGQAIPIWALGRTAEYFDRDDLRKTAKEVALRHPFDESLNLWNRVEIDGEVLSFDRTLNHQIAFAAAVSEIAEFDQGLETRLMSFLNGLAAFLEYRPDGLIRHLVKTPFIVNSDHIKNMPVSLLNRVLFGFHRDSDSTLKKEIGYQSVNLFWLAQIKKNYGHHSIWNSQLVRQVYDYIHSAEYLTTIEENEMAFTNTTTGFQNAFAASQLQDADEIVIRAWIEEQVKNSYDYTERRLGKGASAPDLMASTICHLVDLPNLTLFQRKKSGIDLLEEVFQEAK